MQESTISAISCGASELLGGEIIPDKCCSRTKNLVCTILQEQRLGMQKRNKLVVSCLLQAFKSASTQGSGGHSGAEGP